MGKILDRIREEIRVRRKVRRMLRTWKLVHRLIEEDPMQALIIVGRINRYHKDHLAHGQFMLVYPGQRVVFEEEVNDRSRSIRSQN